MNFYFNPLDIACKSIIGAISNTQKLNIFVDTQGEGENCNLLLRRDDEIQEKAFPMQKTQGGFFVCLSAQSVGLYWYYFVCDGVRYGANNSLLAEENSITPFQLSVFSDGYKTPEWIKGGIIYQIFPDRFCKSGDFEVGFGKVKQTDWNADPTFRNKDGLVLNNEFFGGNFNGIADKLDYISSLGVNCIYLNPINVAYSSHRYDTGDYLSFDSVLGGEDDLKNLLCKASEKGIKVVFDGVYNHTGADSVYFNKYGNYRAIGAFNDKNSPYYSWYSFSSYPDKYEGWWGFETLPSIRKNCKDFQNFICQKVIRKNMQLGFFGVRLDVVDELESDFVKSIRKSIKSENPDALVIGEVWEDATNKIAYDERKEYFLGSQLDSVMNYPLKDAIINYLLSKNSDFLAHTISRQINNFPKVALDCLMNVLSTHDCPRLITVLGRSKVITDKDEMKFETLSAEEYQKGKSLAKIAYALTYTLYGVPSLYYGDEAGVTGNLDPYNRRTYPWGKEDLDLLDFIKSLGIIRRGHKVFESGETDILYQDKGVFVFERCFCDEQIIVASSLGDIPIILEFSREGVDLLSGKKSKTFELAPEEIVILKF